MTVHEDYDAGENGGAMTDAEFYERTLGHAVTAPGGATPGQAAYEAFWANRTPRETAFTFSEELRGVRDAWEAAATAAIAAAAPAPQPAPAAAYEKHLDQVFAPVRGEMDRLRAQLDGEQGAPAAPQDTGGELAGLIANWRQVIAELDDAHPDDHASRAEADTLREVIRQIQRIGQPAPGAAPELAAAMAESRRYREALGQVRAIILEGGSSTEGSRLRRSRAVIRRALEGK